MNQKFKKALEVVFEHEGGYVNDPLDRGGKTKYGITENVRLEFNQHRPPYPIEEITREDAEQVYYELYWKRSGVETLQDALPDEFLIQIFDAAVNHGSGNSVRFLQKAYNLIKIDGPALVEDGILGPRTREAILNTAKRYALALLSAYIGERFSFYKAIINRNPSQLRFIRGWLPRILSGLK